MAGLDEGTVDFKPTYNGEEEEPEVFPGLFPNLLANGASGIAVGMATSIPPHNVGELIDAAVQLIDNPHAEDRGADGVRRRARISRPAACWSTVARRIARAYATGRGSFRLRASRSTVEREKGGGWHLLVSEIPYGVQKGKLIEQIADADRRQEAADPGRRPRRERRAGAARARAARRGRSIPSCCSRACTG